jgi:hypothetical protein
MARPQARGQRGAGDASPKAGRDIEIERKGTRGLFQIKDTGRFDKDNLPRHAPRAHLLRRPPPCYSFAI